MKRDAFTGSACLLAAFLCILAGTSVAGEYAVVIDPDNDVSGSGPGNYSGDITKMTDGSGMNGNPSDGPANWPRGAAHPSTWTNTSFGSYPTEWQCTGSGNGLLIGATNGKIGWITFDLGASLDLAKLYFWNVGNGGGTAGINGCNLYFADNALGIPSPSRVDYQFSAANGWTQYNDDDADPTTARYTIPIGAGDGSYSAMLDVSGVTARFVGVEVITNHGSTSRIGLSEFAAVAIDTNPPTLAPADITDDVGASVDVNNPVTYTLTFSEDMDPSSVTTGDFSNAGSSIAVDYITQTADTIFEVVITPTSAGNLQLRVSSNVLDWAANPMPADVLDVETITVGGDSTPPQVASFTNDRNNGPVAINTPITYTVTFNEYMTTSSVTVADFINGAGAPAPITVNSVTPAPIPHMFYVVVTPTDIGDLLLRIPSGSVSDASGNPTVQNWDDGVTMTVNNPGLVIHEPFEDSDPTLSGNTPGMGLTATWTANGAVESNSLSHGEIVTSFNKAIFNNQYGGVSVGTTLSLLGLLNDGATLWFSALIRTGSDVATNGDLGFALGTDRLSGGNPIPMSNSGNGLGVRFKNNQIRAAYWNNNPNTVAGTGCGPNTVYLIVGKYEWGATNDTVTIYNVGTDLLLPAPASSFSVSVDQSQYDTVTVGTKSANPQHAVDEIRFGSTYQSVIVIPPPSGMVLRVK